MTDKKKKRILIFSLAYHPFIGGAELALRHITDRLPEYEFDIVTLRLDACLPEFERVGNVGVYRVGIAKRAPKTEDLVSFPWYIMKIFYPVRACMKACLLHRRRRYDAVWAMMAYAGFAAVLFKWWHPNIPYILTLQEGDSVEHMTKRLRIRLVAPLFRRVFQTADIVQTISRYLAGFARSMGYRGRIDVIPNGVDIAKFHFVGRRGGMQGKTVLVTVSRLVAKNAVDDIIRALPLLPAQVILRVAGDGPLRGMLKTLAVELGVLNRVEFLGNIAHEATPEILHSSDIFIRPSRSEGMGTAFIEAMAAELPVIGTAVGGITDFLKDGETGLVCETDNPESIAEQVRRLIEEPALGARLAGAALAMVEKKYDWDTIARDMDKKIFSTIEEEGHDDRKNNRV